MEAELAEIPIASPTPASAEAFAGGATVIGVSADSNRVQRLPNTDPRNRRPSAAPFAIPAAVSAMQAKGFLPKDRHRSA